MTKRLEIWPSSSINHSVTLSPSFLRPPPLRLRHTRSVHDTVLASRETHFRHPRCFERPNYLAREQPADAAPERPTCWCRLSSQSSATGTREAHAAPACISGICGLEAARSPILFSHGVGP